MGITGFPQRQQQFKLTDHKQITVLSNNQSSFTKSPFQTLLPQTFYYNFFLKSSTFNNNLMKSTSYLSFSNNQESKPLSLSQLTLYNLSHRTKTTFNTTPHHQTLITPFKLFLICILSFLSISKIVFVNNSHWVHVRQIKNYFSIYALGQDSLSIYDQGSNFDQTYIEIFSLQKMHQHFTQLSSFMNNYKYDGFSEFNQKLQFVNIEMFYKQQLDRKTKLSFKQFQDLIPPILDFREAVLPLRAIHLEFNLGANKIVDNIKLIFHYSLHSSSMLKLTMNVDYEADHMQIKFRTYFSIFISIILCSSFLLKAAATYLKQKQNKNELYWLLSLAFLNIGVIVSPTLAPFCCVMQLLPILETHSSSSFYVYNFNVNLRYAIPIVLRVLIPMYMVLNGFIFYSILVYSGKFFDDYQKSFFAYFYNGFQYGILEVFEAIEGNGNGAFFLYISLHFWNVFVGSNLIPAFFCTLIYRKIAEKQLMSYVEAKLQMLVCPQCNKELYKKSSYGMQININSPGSPYLQQGTRIQNEAKRSGKIAKMYLEDSEYGFLSPKISPQMTLKNSHKKARDLVNDVKECIEFGFDGMRPLWIRAKIVSIQKILEIY